MAKKGGQLVCLVGIDGTGKTYHARRLVNEFPAMVRPKYVWLHAPHFLSLPFMALCRVLGLTRVHVFKNGKKFSEHQYYRNKAIACVWPWVQLLDAVIFVSIKIYIPLGLGTVLICDRFVHDVLVDLMSDTGQNDLHHRVIGKLILRLVPRSSRVLVLDADEGVVLRRKNDIPNLEYLSKRRKLYHTLTSYLDVPCFDCSKSVDSVHASLVGHLYEVSY